MYIERDEAKHFPSKIFIKPNCKLHQNFNLLHFLQVLPLDAVQPRPQEKVLPGPGKNKNNHILVLCFKSLRFSSLTSDKYAAVTRISNGVDDVTLFKAGST